MTLLPAADVERPLEPLWRGLLVYRVLTLLSSIAVVLYTLDEFASAAGAVGVLAVMTGWTGVTTYGYFGGLPGARDGRGRFAIADLAVTAGVMATTLLVQSPAQIAGDDPVMGSIWTPGAVLACALFFGVRGGLAGAAVISVMLLLVSATFRTELGDIELIVLVGVVVGFASTVLRRSAERLRRAVAAEAAATNANGSPAPSTTGCCRSWGCCAGGAPRWVARRGSWVRWRASRSTHCARC